MGASYKNSNTTSRHDRPDYEERINKSSFAASAASAGTPSLIPGLYPRAHPVEVFARPDGSVDYAFVWEGEWHLLPESALEHAATEVSASSEAVWNSCSLLSKWL